MAFSRTGNVITQSGTNGSESATDLTTRGLDGIASDLTVNTDYTLRYDGNVAVYTLAAGVSLNITGSLTLNPEIERLEIDDDDGIMVSTSTGVFRLGKRITVNGLTRNTKGVGIFFNNAPVRWWGLAGGTTGTNSTRLGGGTNFRIMTGASLSWIGAEIRGPCSFSALFSSSVRIADATMTVFDLNAADTDPTTGNTAASSAGLYAQGGVVLSNGRGYISWFNTDDIAVDGLTVCNGGEIAFVTPPSGMNGVDNSVQNGIRGYNPINTVLGAFPNRTDAQSFTDSRIGGNGNIIDVTIQSERDLQSGSGATGPRPNPTVTTLTNEAAGTNLIINGAEAGTASNRNFGSVIVQRAFNIQANTLAGGTAVSGGRYFIRDTDNGRRTNLNSRDDTSDYTYSAALNASGNIASDANVVLGVVKLEGTNARSTATPPNNPVAGNDYAIDLRGKNNTIGEDFFDLHFWHPQYQYVTATDFDMSDGTTGTREWGINLAVDANYQTANFAAAGEIRTIDEIYKAEKDRKVSSEANIELPLIGDLYTTPDAGLLDLDDIDFVVTPTGSERYSTTAPTPGAAGVLTGNFAGGGTAAADVSGINRIGSATNGRLTRETTNGQFPLTGDYGLSTSVYTDRGTDGYRDNWLQNDAAWSTAMSFHVVASEDPSDRVLASGNTHALIYVDASNWAVYSLGASLDQGGVHSRELTTLLHHMGDAGGTEQADVLFTGSESLLFTLGDPVGGSVMVVNAANQSLTRGTIFRGIRTDGDANNGGNALAYDLQADNITGLPSSGEIITVDGKATGNIALAAGTYNINGDASDAVFSRSGTTGTVTLIFGPNATRPTANLGANVVAPFIVTVNSRSDTGGRLDVYQGTTALTANTTSGNTTTYNISTSGTNIVVVYTAPGRTDFREATTVTTDSTVNVVNEANPFPALDSGLIVSNYTDGFTFARTGSGTGQITVTNNTNKTTGTGVNIALQNLVKGSEPYNQIIRDDADALNSVRSLGPDSAAMVDSDHVTFAASSPITIGNVQGDTTALAPTTLGRFFTPSGNDIVNARWDYATGGSATPGTGTFSIGSFPGHPNQVMVINDVDAAGTNQGTALDSLVAGDFLTITRVSTSTVTAYALAGAETDSTGEHQIRLGDAINIADFVNGEEYLLNFRDAVGSDVRVGVTISAPSAFDPGVTASQITRLGDDIGNIVDTELRRSPATKAGRR